MNIQHFTGALFAVSLGSWFYLVWTHFPHDATGTISEWIFPAVFCLFIAISIEIINYYD